jgi:SapC
VSPEPVAGLALVNNVDHRDIRIITERSAAYGDDVMFAMTFPFEFRSVQAFYPILFHRDGNGDLYPVALFGFKEKENLFLDESGWHAHYVPAMIRRQPFLIGYQDFKSHADPRKARMLSMDTAHPRVNKDLGEPLFQPLGGRTPYLEEMATLLEQVYAGYVHNKEFINALQENDLIESVTFDIALKDGSRNQLFGFHALNEEKVQQLSADTLWSFSQKGFLMPIFMMLASTVNVRSLVEMKTRRLES